MHLYHSMASYKQPSDVSIHAKRFISLLNCIG